MAGHREALVKSLVVPALQRVWQNAIVLDEPHMGGGRRADLALVMPDWLILVEIKSAGDSIERWGQQQGVYSKVANQLILVADRKFIRLSREVLLDGSHLQKVAKSRADLAGVSDVIVTEGDSKIIGWVQGGQRVNRRPKLDRARGMLDMLTKDELALLAAVRGFPPCKYQAREHLPFILSQWCGADIIPHVLQVLRNRPFGGFGNRFVSHHAADATGRAGDAAAGKSGDFTGHAAA